MFVKRFLKNRDAFGHEFKLRISDKQSESEQSSALGGCTTLGILAITIIYLWVQIQKLSDKQLDNLTQFTVGTEFDALGSVNMSDVMPVLFIDLENQLDYFSIKM